MLRSLTGLRGSPVRTRDGVLGSVAGVLLNHVDWSVTHVVIHLGAGWHGRDVLIDPAVVLREAADATSLPVTLTRRELEAQSSSAEPDGSSRIDSRVLVGRHLAAVDGEIGHVDDVILDDVTWRVRYLVVDTSNWVGGRWVLISPEWLDERENDTGPLAVGLHRESIRQAPGFDRARPLTREDETALYGHYGMREYWLP